MGATSVTGTGFGDSQGEYKAENQAASCCSSGPTPPVTPPTPVKTHCVTRISTGYTIRYKLGGRTSLRVCAN